MNGNKIEIEVKFKIKSSEGSPLGEGKQQYKSAKEAAKQLGLNLEEEWWGLLFAIDSLLDFYHPYFEAAIVDPDF